MQAIDELNLLLGIGPPRVKLPLTLQKSGYSAVRPIGKGGFGQAHLIFHAAQAKYFVAKHVNMAQMTSRQRKDAHNEIDMLQQLEHPNIIRYVEYVEEPPNLYIVMEYADGGDLYSHLKKVAVSGRLLSEEQVMSLFTQTALALKHMHDRRMLHRDIKAQNVFLTKSHAVKLGDFGISTVLNSTMAMAQTMCGTPCYFSPELCQGKPYNNKSDIWALGVLLYEMCTTGELPFEAPNVRKLMDCICNQEARPISSEYSRGLADLVAVMLAKDPKQRPDINAVLRNPVVQRYMSAEAAALATAPPPAASALPPPPPPATEALPPLGKPPRVAHHNHVSPPHQAAPTPAAPEPAPLRGGHDDHRDVLLAELPPPPPPRRVAAAVPPPPAPPTAAEEAEAAAILRPHQHFNDTSAATSGYQPALLLAAARRAASEESRSPPQHHTVDDWRALSDAERDEALQGGAAALLSPQYVKSGGSVVDDDVTDSVDGPDGQQYFNDQFMTTLDTAAIVADAEAAQQRAAPPPPEVPPQAAPTPSLASPIMTTSRRSVRGLTQGAGGGLRLTSEQRASLRRQAARASVPVDVVPLSESLSNGQHDPTSSSTDNPTTATTSGALDTALEDTCIGGNCLCGATVYAAWLSMAIGTFACDCMACRRFSGSHQVEWIHFPDVPFSELLQHSPAAKTFVVVPNAVETYFCGECGSTIAMAHADVEGCVVARATLSDTSMQVLAAATTPQRQH